MSPRPSYESGATTHTSTVAKSTTSDHALASATRTAVATSPADATSERTRARAANPLRLAGIETRSRTAIPQGSHDLDHLGGSPGA
jgi:hypothetical protein